MAYTIVRTDSREVTITAGVNDLTVLVQRAKSDYGLETFVASTTVGDTETYTITYDDDGIYIITVTESGVATKYIDLCIENIYDHLKLDIVDILSTAVDICDYSGKRYDLITLLLLGLQIFGNTTYSLYIDATSWTTLPTSLQIIEDAIVRSTLYMELNGTSTQSTN